MKAPRFTFKKLKTQTRDLNTLAWGGGRGGASAPAHLHPLTAEDDADSVLQESLHDVYYVGSFDEEERKGEGAVADALGELVDPGDQGLAEERDAKGELL